MCKALYIEDEKSAFVVSLLDSLKEIGIGCTFQDWASAAECARTDEGISFERLSENLELEKYDLLLIDVMMPPEGIIGTYDGFLTGIILHKKLLEVSASIKRKKTFFITNLPYNKNPDSYYGMAKYYADLNMKDSLFRKNDPDDIASEIKNAMSNKEIETDEDN